MKACALQVLLLCYKFMKDVYKKENINIRMKQLLLFSEYVMMSLWEGYYYFKEVGQNHFLLSISFLNYEYNQKLLGYHVLCY